MMILNVLQISVLIVVTQDGELVQIKSPIKIQKSKWRIWQIFKNKHKQDKKKQ